MIYLRCPDCAAKCDRDGFKVRGQFCMCGWWRDRPPSDPPHHALPVPISEEATDA
jgi:hypothetical protein